MKSLTVRSILALVTLWALSVVSPALAQANLLRDPSFEGEAYSTLASDPSAGVTFNLPVDWGGYVIRGSGQPTWQNVLPTGFPHTGPMRRGGFRSLHIARGGGTFTAIVYQRVNVAPGTPLAAGAWANVDSPFGLARVGIDPLGGTDAGAGSVVWSQWLNPYNFWAQATVNSTAVSGTVTLFLYATQQQPYDPNGIYWDDAFLNGTAAPAPQPQPQPQPQQPTGNTLSPTVQLNVRSGAGTSFGILGRISPGSSWQIVGQQGAWYAINYNGQTGYVSGAYVTLNSGSAPQPQQPVTGPAWRANVTTRVRGGPGTSFPILTRVPGGSTVSVVGRTIDSSWLQVEYFGVRGWVLRQLGSFSGGDLTAIPVTQ